jgi:succinate dehydrogenase/fumarate reductase flavoprotein subunit
MEQPVSWDLEVDVAVLGSGGAALAAAVTAADGGAATVVLERADLVGGTSATSGGICWIPNNHHQAALGIQDSREDALAYLSSLSLGVMDMELATAFIDNGPAAIRYLEENTPLKFHIAIGYPDYHPENPGGKPAGGRSLDPDLFSFKELGPWADRVNRQGTDLHPQAPVRPVMLVESMETGLPSPEVLQERASRDERGLGQALIGALLKGCLDREVPVMTGIRARDLVRSGDAVIGVRCERDGRDYWVKARKAVILATGGFEWNRDLVNAFLRGPLDGPASPPENEGDGLLMAMDIGAALGNMSEAWWMPTIPIPGETVRGKPLFRLCLAERTLPGSILVNRRGRRFVNEAANYNDIGRAFHTFDPLEFSFANNPAWLVFDEGFRSRYPIGGYMPGAPLPDGFLFTGETLESLAAAIGVDAANLEATVERFNTYAAKGEDPDFQRGVSAYDTYNGDRSKPGAFATLGTIEQAPFHAIKLVAGALGTKGGPKTNADGQVLDIRGRVIPGLYAAGNAMAGSTGLVYGGAGGTLGPGLTFGYLAGRAAAREAPRA